LHSGFDFSERSYEIPNEIKSAPFLGMAIKIFDLFRENAIHFQEKVFS